MLTSFHSDYYVAMNVNQSLLTSPKNYFEVHESVKWWGNEIVIAICQEMTF